MTVKHTSLTLSAGSLADLMRRIKYYQKRGYGLDDLWLERHYVFFVTYYATLVVTRRLNIVVGPVSTRPLPPLPKPPRLVITIGPVSQRRD
jgi:hypothetical protein